MSERQSSSEVLPAHPLDLIYSEDDNTNIVGSAESSDNNKDGEDNEDVINFKGSEDDNDDNDDNDDTIDLKVDEDEKSKDGDGTIDDEDLKIVGPPKKKQLLKDYPDLFKKHPYLEGIIYRDKQYQELFGSLDDAKEIRERADLYDEVEKNLLSGSSELILKNLKNADQKAFDKLVDNYLSNLAKVDKEAYFDVVGNIGRQIVVEMLREAKSSEDEDLKAAAALLNKFLFNSSELQPPKIRSAQKKEEVSEVEQERINFLRERFEAAQSDLSSRVNNMLRSTVSEYIDPKGQMTPYIKRQAIKDVVDELHQTLRSDKSVERQLDNLWRDAFNKKFTKDSLDRIQSFYLGKAKYTLAPIIKKVRAEALKGLVRPKNENGDSDVVRRQTEGRPARSSGKLTMKPGESVIDFLSRD